MESKWAKDGSLTNTLLTGKELVNEGPNGTLLIESTTDDVTSNMFLELVGNDVEKSRSEITLILDGC